MKIKHIDHIGINVENLESAKVFFTDLGFTVMGEATMQGDLVERVIGLKDVRDDLVMLQAPDGQLNIELIKFHSPVDPEGVRIPAANTLGMRHLAFQVDNLEEIVIPLKQKGYELMGEIQNYEDIWKLCYVRGPEGLIVELAEQIEK
jgi:catechol 2,3-dioxygenase-like lactoylglutathione lyase family enzyme